MSDGNDNTSLDLGNSGSTAPGLEEVSVSSDETLRSLLGIGEEYFELPTTIYTDRKKVCDR